jgi:hypothetical protein
VSVEVESGNQYTALRAANRWYDFGRANWEPYNDQYVGKFYGKGTDGQEFDWLNRVWRYFKALDPCVTKGDCR